MQTSLPENALLSRYAFEEDGTRLPHYTDCFTTKVSLPVDLKAYVYAFYTTPLFRSERLVLRLLGMPSRDEDITDLLEGRRSSFAAWTIEDRTDTELLMCDVNSRTRSWFKVERTSSETLLYFGSAVIASGDQPPGRYRILFGLHRLYSRRLLGAATSRVSR